MESFHALMHGFAVALTPYHLLLMVVGVLLGILVGVLPGLGAPNGVTLLLPLTFTMPPVSAIILLSCMYWGALFGGSTTSILFNIPGEPSSVATTFDGYPMAQKGHAGEALTAAFTSAFFGALSGVLIITFLSGWVADFAMRFSPPEFFGVYLLTFCSFIGMGRQSPIKSLGSLLLGLGCAAVGMDTISGNLRLTYDVPQLLRGISFLVAVIGLFGIGEILATMEEDLAFKGLASKLNLKVVFQTWKKLPRYWVTLLRSMMIGWWMGVTPGGPTAASFMSYGIAKKMSRNPDKFGTGAMEGVIAPETADHAAGTSALLPMLALGIPGSATAAVMLGGLMIWGLRPGPDAVHRAEGLRLGTDRQHVPGQRRQPDRRARDRAAVCSDPAHPVLDHRAGDHRRVRDRRLHRQQRGLRRRADAGLRRARLLLQEARLPHRADGAGDGARRPVGGGVSPVAAAVAR